MSAVYDFFKDFAAPIGTVIAASAAAFVAYRLGNSQIALGNSQVAVAQTQAAIADRNWQTANERVVLDLFERRLAIYEGIRAVIGSVATSGGTKDNALFRYGEATDRVEYFFGDEVQTYLETVRIHMIDLDLANTMLDNPTVADRGDWAKRRHDHFLGVTDFYKTAPSLFRPYIQAHQKVLG